MGRWHPRPLHQGWQRHHRDRPIRLRRLGLLPLHSPQQGGGGGVAVLCWLWRHWSTWATKGQTSCTPLSPKSSFGIDDIPSVATLNGSPSVALPPQHSSAGNGTSGSIAGSPSSTYSARNVSACSRCVAAQRRTPCRFGVIVDHLPPQPKSPPTGRF